MVEKKHTGNHVSICQRIFMTDCQNPPHTANILFLWVVPLEMPNFLTLITSLTSSRDGDLRDGLCWCFAKMGSMPLLVIVSTVYFPANSRVMEVSLIALWQSSSITTRGCWSSRNDCRCRSRNRRRNNNSVYCHSLLLLVGFLWQFSLSFIPKFLFTASFFGLFRKGWHGALTKSMI